MWIYTRTHKHTTVSVPKSALVSVALILCGLLVPPWVMHLMPSSQIWQHLVELQGQKSQLFPITSSVTLQAPMLTPSLPYPRALGTKKHPYSNTNTL